MEQQTDSLFADAYVNNSRSGNNEAWGDYLKAKAFNERLGAFLGIGLVAIMGGMFMMPGGVFNPDENLGNEGNAFGLKDDLDPLT